jgi:hypothetical protein
MRLSSHRRPSSDDTASRHGSCILDRHRTAPSGTATSIFYHVSHAVAEVFSGKLGTCIRPMYTRTRVRTMGHRPALFARFRCFFPCFPCFPVACWCSCCFEKTGFCAAPEKNPAEPSQKCFGIQECLLALVFRKHRVLCCFRKPPCGALAKMFWHPGTPTGARVFENTGFCAASAKPPAEPSQNVLASRNARLYFLNNPHQRSLSNIILATRHAQKHFFYLPLPTIAAWFYLGFFLCSHGKIFRITGTVAPLL